MQPQPWPDRSLIDSAVEFARILQTRASQLQTRAERRQQAELDRLLRAPREKATLLQITDQAFRSHSAARTVDQFTHILDAQGIPRFFSPVERALLKGFQSFGGWAPGVAVPLVKEHMRHESANVVLPAEAPVLMEHLRHRMEAGIRMNVNLLGEAILGEAEAHKRLGQYLGALHLPEIEVMSVKISTLYSQISPLAREHTLAILCDRLEQLYREAAHLEFVRRDGARVRKFIYLDMEEYRDKELTAEAFMRTLDRPGLESVSGGIALQAYIPDSFRTQQAINAWARRRVAYGGAPVRIRIVKGANMEMERVEASLRGWPQAPFKTKCETDANYKRMLHEALRPENLEAVHVGVASHNLFDLAYGLVLAAHVNAGPRVQFEMLEGMANHQRRALLEHTSNLLLYAPACRKEDFVNAIGYLIRRLDENTGPNNFLRHAFRLEVDTPEWNQLVNDFRRCFDTPVSAAPRRTQDRRTPPTSQPAPLTVSEFRNEPDTDFALPQNVTWAEEVTARWRERVGTKATGIPLVIDGETIGNAHAVRDCVDPSRPGVIVGRYREASAADIDRAVACAQRDDDGWRTLSADERLEVLNRVADEVARARGDLIGAAMANGGKIIPESDPEVSEAIDFLRFYAASAREFFELPGVQARPKGVVAVVPPWNFPIAIPCGGIAAALAAGNTVLLKPATPTVLIAWELCQCFWRAGVSKKTLQFVPCSVADGAPRLVNHPGVSSVILTGGTATAMTLLRNNPKMRLSAETGGKNATIVTALSDHEQAVKHVVHSAFSHSGQKCSATSLLLLEAEVYDDPAFREMLVDAARSLVVGSAWEPQTRVGPLIHPPRGDLLNALTKLEPGEEWVLTPERDADNPALWSPGIKYGVQPGGYTHQTEFFGPVLGVMRFTKLAEAIRIVNETGYGLTSGLQSLDDREQEEWKAGVRAGNLYINKPTVGAVVLRQPFGGFGKSCVGPGLKAGGPNYVSQFIAFADDAAATNAAGMNARPEMSDKHEAGLGSLLGGLAKAQNRIAADELQRLHRAIASYQAAWRTEFAVEHDHFRLLGEDNIRRYRPVKTICIRVDSRDTPHEIFARACAARIAGCRIVISEGPQARNPAAELLDQLTDDWAGGVEFIQQADQSLAAVIRAGEIERVRFAAPQRVPEEIRRAAADAGAHLADAPVQAAGRLELLHYLHEQSVSFAYHRYGNLGARTGEPRDEPL